MSKKPSLFAEKGMVCWLCGNPHVEVHHIYPSSRRPISEREGCTIPLCHEHHQGSVGVHSDRQFDRWLRGECQRRWESREGLEGEEAHEEFRKVFYESYL